MRPIIEAFALALGVSGALTHTAVEGAELVPNWTRSFESAVRATVLPSPPSCSSPTGELLVIVRGMADDPSARHAAILVDAKGESTKRDLAPFSEAWGYLARVTACLATADGWLIVGQSGREEDPGAVWLDRSLSRTSSLELVGKRSLPQVRALAEIGAGRWAAVGNFGVETSIAVFDRETVAWLQPESLLEKPHIAYDVTSTGDGFVVCAVEGETEENPKIEDIHLALMSFDREGVVRAAKRMPGRACRLFATGADELVLLGDDGKIPPPAGLRHVRLNRRLEEVANRELLPAIHYLFELEATRVGDAYVVLSRAFAFESLAVVDPSLQVTKLELDLPAGAPYAVRAGGDSVYLLSLHNDLQAKRTTLRVDSYALR